MISQTIPIMHDIAVTANFVVGPPTDFSAWDVVTLYVRTRLRNGTPTTANLAIQAQEREPWDVTETLWKDIPAKAIAPLTVSTTMPDLQKIILTKGVDFSKFVRFNGTVSFTGGTAPSWTLTINLAVQAQD